MSHRPDHLEAGRQLLELQLAMMTGAMTLMADSAQRLVELGLRAAPGAAKGLARGDGVAEPPPAAAGSHQARGRSDAPPPARTARLDAAGKDYTLRMQQDVDSILHAFAMVPDAADRLIRTSALLTEKPGREAGARASRPVTAVPAGRRPARRDPAEHAR